MDGKLTVFLTADAMDNDALHDTMTEEIRRKAVLAGINAGRSHRAIAEFNKLSLSFVYEMQRDWRDLYVPRTLTPNLGSLSLALTTSGH